MTKGGFGRFGALVPECVSGETIDGLYKLYSQFYTNSIFHLFS